METPCRSQRGPHLSDFGEKEHDEGSALLKMKVQMEMKMEMEMEVEMEMEMEMKKGTMTEAAPW